MAHIHEEIEIQAAPGDVWAVAGVAGACVTRDS